METELYLQSLDEESRAALEKLVEEIKPLIENLLDAIREFWEKIRAACAEALALILPALTEFYEDLQRAEVYTRLRAWHVPHWIALPAARYWPRRWLPDRLSYLFDNVEQKD